MGISTTRVAGRLTIAMPSLCGMVEEFQNGFGLDAKSQGGIDKLPSGGCGIGLDWDVTGFVKKQRIVHAGGSLKSSFECAETQVSYPYQSTLDLLIGHDPSTLETAGHRRLSFVRSIAWRL